MKELTLLEQMILATIIALEKEAFGVSIRKKVEILTGKRLMYGTLYNALDQLLRKDYVSKTKGTTENINMANHPHFRSQPSTRLYIWLLATRSRPLRPAT